jgi:hypothetical protein
MLPNRLLCISGCAAVLLIAAQPSQAAEITFQGYTDGCFNLASNPNCTPAQNPTTPQTVSVGNDLDFTDASFGPTQSTGGALNLTLGSFSLHPVGSDSDFDAFEFQLRVTFTLPTVMSGSSSPVFTAVLEGDASSSPGQCNPGPNPCGGVSVDFNNTPTLFSYSNASASGSFKFYVDDFSLTLSGANASGNLLGHITEAVENGPILEPLVVTPEPGSILLMGTGLGALAFRTYRRRRA